MSAATVPRTRRPFRRSDAPKEVFALEEYVGKDKHWAHILENALKTTPTPATLEDALLPMSALVLQALKDSDEPDVEGTPNTLEETQEALRAHARDCVEEMKGRLPDMPDSKDINPEHAGCINSYTKEYSSRDIEMKCYQVMSKTLHNTAMRQTGNQVSDTVRQVLPYAKLLDESLKNLPECYHVRGKEVWRGVRWVFPSPTKYDPKSYFFRGRTLWWFESRSTSESREKAEEFAGKGDFTAPGTVFKVFATHAYSIRLFSEFPEEEEILFPMLSKFKVGDVQANYTESCTWGEPDVIELQRWAPPRQLGTSRPGSTSVASSTTASQIGTSELGSSDGVECRGRWRQCLRLESCFGVRRACRRASSVPAPTQKSKEALMQQDTESNRACADHSGQDPFMQENPEARKWHHVL